MKKSKVLATVLSIVAVVVLGFNLSISSKSNSSDISFLNVEAMSGESSVGNTGPSESVVCATGGTKEVCRCRNPYPCTPGFCS
jgi:hypothetical protein